MRSLSSTSRPSQLLRRGDLSALPAALNAPTYDLASLRPGFVHLGVGVFHRSHQLDYLDRLARLDPAAGWSVTGVGLRSCQSRDELLAQDCLYTLIERTGEDASARVVGVLSDYLSAAEQPAAVLQRLADPSTEVVGLTITAPTYSADGDGGVFDLQARALELRQARGLQPFTVLSCDNLLGNGNAARRRVVAAAAERSDLLASWIERNGAFPNSMVDRITPPPSLRDQQWLRQEFGLRDRAPVSTEVASTWVIEDSFVGARPALDRVGVRFTSDVGPYVDAKSRLLNGAHLALGYLAPVLGYSSPGATTHEAMADPQVRRLVRRMLAREVAPGLRPIPGVDLGDYLAEVLGRLADPAIGDPLARLRRRGSVRVVQYLAPSLEEALRSGRPHGVLTDVMTAWVASLIVAQHDVRSGRRSLTEVLDDLADPAAERLLPLADGAAHDVRPLLAAVPGLERLAGHAGLVSSVQLRLAVPGPTDQERVRASAS